MKAQNLLPLFWNRRSPEKSSFLIRDKTPSLFPGGRVFLMAWGLVLSVAGLYPLPLPALPSDFRPFAHNLQVLVPEDEKNLSENLRWLLQYMNIPWKAQNPLPPLHWSALPPRLQTLFQKKQPVFHHLLQTLQPGQKKFHTWLSFLEKHLGKQEVINMMLQEGEENHIPSEIGSLLDRDPPPARRLSLFALLYQYSTPEGIRSLDFLAGYIHSAFPEREAKGILKTLLKHPFLIFSLLPASDLRDPQTPFHRLIRFVEKYTGGKKALVHLIKASLPDPRFCVFNIPLTTFQANVGWVEKFINTTEGFKGRGKKLLVFHLNRGWFNHQLLLEDRRTSYRLLRVSRFASQASVESIVLHNRQVRGAKERVLREYILPPSPYKLKSLLSRQKQQNSLLSRQCVGAF